MGLWRELMNNMLQGKEKQDKNSPHKRHLKDDKKIKRINSETKANYVAVGGIEA